MKCGNCNKENIRVFISVQMYIDAQYYKKLTKKVIAKKSTEIWSMSDRASFVCADCGYTWGYGYEKSNKI